MFVGELWEDWHRGAEGSGELSLALVLVIGFGLHNATEGFGIVAPLAGDMDLERNSRQPSAKARRPDLLAYGLLLGLSAGFLTDAIITAAGV